MMRPILLTYSVVGLVLAPFLMAGIGLGKRQPWLTVVLIWLVLALVWPFAVVDYCLFIETRKDRP